MDKQEKKEIVIFKVFFTDGTHLSVECDDVRIRENCFYYTEVDGMLDRTFPIRNVKYTIIKKKIEAKE